MTDQEGAEGHAPNPTEIRVLSVGKSLKIEPFKILEEPLEVGRAWREWIEDFEDEISYFEITEIRDRVRALKIYGKSKERVLSHTQRDCAKSHRIANSASKKKTEYWNT